MTLAFAIAPLPDAPQAERGAQSSGTSSASAARTLGAADTANATNTAIASNRAHRANASNASSQLALCAGPSETEQVAFELGWAHAHHGITPPLPLLHAGAPLHHGWVAGVAAHGRRTAPASRFARAWLALRLSAWAQGHAVELMHITPKLLAQTEVSHCPITRESISLPLWARLHQQAACAAGNLVAFGLQGLQMHRALAWAPVEPTDLDAAPAEQARLWVLRSFAQALPHAVAARLPLRVLPPNRVRLFNPVQALQAFVSKQFLTEGWSHRLARLEALIPGVENQHRFRYFVMALMPRVVAAGAALPTHALRWAVEDAWACPRVQRRWTAFALGLSAPACEDLLQRAHALQLGQGRLECSNAAQATDGWRLAHHGLLN